jgi:hypothetical protein
MVMNGGGRGVALLSSGGGDACDIIWLVRGCECLWCLPMYYCFQGTLPLDEVLKAF